MGSRTTNNCWRFRLAVIDQVLISFVRVCDNTLSLHKYCVVHGRSSVCYIIINNNK